MLVTAFGNFVVAYLAARIVRIAAPEEMRLHRSARVGAYGKAKRASRPQIFPNVRWLVTTAARRSALQTLVRRHMSSLALAPITTRCGITP